MSRTYKSVIMAIFVLVLSLNPVMAVTASSANCEWIDVGTEDRRFSSVSELESYINKDPDRSAASLDIMNFRTEGGILQAMPKGCCGWRTVELNGRTFDSRDQLASYIEEQGYGSSFTMQLSPMKFRVTEGTLELEAPEDQQATDAACESVDAVSNLASENGGESTQEGNQAGSDTINIQIDESVARTAVMLLAFLGAGFLLGQHYRENEDS